jgi:hypothetical protein
MGKSEESALAPVRKVQNGGDAGPETLPVSATSTPMTCDNELPSAPKPEDVEQRIDYSSSPEHMSFGDN